MLNDPISNLLTVIRNALMTNDKSKHRTISVNSSKQLVKIADILYKNGYIEKYIVKDNEPKKPILIIFLNNNSSKTKINGLKRISKPGLRVYVESKKLPTVVDGMGIAIISTSEGIITNREAKKLGLGGEVLAFVW